MLSLKGNFFQGVFCFWQGLLLIFSPGIKRYIYIPIIINILLFVFVFAGLAWVLFGQFSAWIVAYPKWLIWLLGWLFWLLYGILVLLISTFTFTLATNIVASPFYGRLAEAVEKTFEGTIYSAPISIPRILWRELRKITYFMPWLLLFAILLLIPPLWPALPFIIFLPLASFVAMQYIDYCPDNQGVSLKVVRVQLKEHYLTALGFGSAVSIAMSIPGANLVVPPAAVAGGCILWLQLQRKNRNNQDSKHIN